MEGALMIKQQKNNNKVSKTNIQINPHKTLIEQLYEKGWLEYRRSRFDSKSRLQVALKLMYNYQIIKRANLHSGYIFNNKIDSSITLESHMYSDAVNYYRQCLRAVPAEFWGIVRRICLEEKLPVISQDLSERQQAYLNYLYRIDLCRGLDRLLQLKIDNK